MPFKPTATESFLYTSISTRDIQKSQSGKAGCPPDTHHGETSWITQNPTTSSTLNINETGESPIQLLKELSQQLETC